MGAQINQNRFNSTGEYQAFGPWEQSHGASFFPPVFDTRTPPSTMNPGTSLLVLLLSSSVIGRRSPPHLVFAGSSVVMDHFVAYVQGATADMSKDGPFG